MGREPERWRGGLGGARIGAARFDRLTRRRFLRGVGITTFGLAGAALVGCTDEDDEPAPAGTVAGTPAVTPATTGTPAAAATGTAPAPAGAAGSADVLGIWGAEELDSFRAMVQPWEQETGGTVDFTGTRDLTAILTTRVEGGNPPDIAIPAEVGLFRQFASDGTLVPLETLGIAEDVNGSYPAAFTELGSVDGTLYGFFMKADTKGTIWYNPRLFEENGWQPLSADSSWEDLIALSNEIAGTGTPPWSIGIESGGASGWPGTDWIQQILLNVHGPEVYDGIIDGSIPFTDDRMKDAWEKFGEIALGEGMTAQGGAAGINATNFQDAVFLPFRDPPEAAMVYLGGFAAGFIMEQFPDLAAGEGFDFFPWPGGGVTGGANIVYAFNDSETTRLLMRHLASADAQRVWVELGGFTSVNEEVSLDAYPDDVARKQAEQLTQAEVFRFDLDDAIGGALQTAYFEGVTQYLANPDQLDAILQSIESARGG